MVIVGVAGFACHAFCGKALVLVASCAGKGRMFAEQRKARQRMVKGDLFLPADRIVATRAICPELAFMDIIIGMAAHASNG